MELQQDKFLGYENLYWENEEVKKDLMEVALEMAKNEDIVETIDEEIHCLCEEKPNEILYFCWQHPIKHIKTKEYYEWEMCVKSCPKCHQWIIELEN